MSLNNKNKNKSAKDEKKSKPKKHTVDSLFQNDKFLLTVSMFAAFIIWVFMSADVGETVNYPITEIPVTLELSEDAKNDNLSVVTVDGVPIDDFTATVKVKGNSVTVGSLKPSDIQVYGSNMGNIITSGSYNVSLFARQIGVKNNYDIVSVTPSEVKLVVDRSTVSEIPLEAQINATSPVEYYIGAASLSQQSVMISGPEQIVSKVAKAVVSTDVEKELEDTTTLTNLEVFLIDSSGEKIESDSISITPNEVDATIPVLVKKTVPLKLSYINAPADFNDGKLINIEPPTIEVAASPKLINSVDSITIGTIDFGEISYGMSSTSYSIVMPEGVRNLNNIENAMVNFDFSDYLTKAFVMTQFDFSNVPSGLAAEQTSYGGIIVRAIGPKSEIVELTSKDIVAKIDLNNAKVGTSVMQVDVYINKDNTKCWIYGSYTTNVTVKNKDDVSSVSSKSSD